MRSLIKKVESYKTNGFFKMFCLSTAARKKPILQWLHFSNGSRMRYWPLHLSRGGWPSSTKGVNRSSLWSVTCFAFYKSVRVEINKPSALSIHSAVHRQTHCHFSQILKVTFHRSFFNRSFAPWIILLFLWRKSTNLIYDDENLKDLWQIRIFFMNSIFFFDLSEK